MKLIDYIRGNRHGKDANRVERDAMTDAFLQEALDGYDSVISNHLNSIARLEEKVLAKSKGNKSKKLIIYWSAAASIALVISLGSLYFVNHQNESEEYFAKVETKQKVENQTNNPQEESNLTPTKEEANITTESKIVEQELEKSKEIKETKKAVSPTKEISKSSAEALTKADKKTLEALQGKVAGVQVRETEGAPNAEMKIRVRGGSSTTQANEPLYIVDGKAVSNINDISSDRIKSVEVLKDASATSIYGSKGANGVVVITTKSEFGKKEFKKFFYSKAKKGICGSKKASVDVEFTVNGSGYPSSFRLPEFSCDEAKEEVIRVLRYSPKWTTNIGEKVKLKLEWK